MRKEKRKNRVLIDYLRNSRGATFVAPYSTRARDGAPLSVPVGWEELGPEVRSDRWNVKTLPRRLQQLRQGPWEGIDRIRQSLTRDARREVGLAD